MERARAAAIFLPLGFFLSVGSPNSGVPNRAVLLIYIGALVLAFSVATLGIGRFMEPMPVDDDEDRRDLTKLGGMNDAS